MSAKRTAEEVFHKNYVVRPERMAEAEAVARTWRSEMADAAGLLFALVGLSYLVQAVSGHGFAWYSLTMLTVAAGFLVFALVRGARIGRREDAFLRGDVRERQPILDIIDVETPWGSPAAWVAAGLAQLHAEKSKRRAHLEARHALTAEQAAELYELEQHLPALAGQVVSLVSPGALMR